MQSSKTLEESKTERQWGRRAHLSTLFMYLGIFFPIPFPWMALGNVLSPFLIYLQRNKSSYSARQSLEALYLQAILGALYWGIFTNYPEDRTAQIFLGFLPLSILHFVFLMIAVFKTTLGKEHHYPFSFFPRLFTSKKTKIEWKKIQTALGNESLFTDFRKQITNLENCIQFLEQKSLEASPQIRNAVGGFLPELQTLKNQLLEEPKFYSNARQFLNYFPEVTMQILKQSQDLASAKNPTQESKVMELFQELTKTAQSVNQKIHDQKTFHLDVEIEAMKNNLKLGGFTWNPKSKRESITSKPFFPKWEII